MDKADQNDLDQSEAVRVDFGRLVRSLGVLRPDVTPCGERMSVSEAHSIAELYDLGPLSQLTLGTNLRLQKSTVSRLVDQLVERGWAERIADDMDGRVSLVGLTVVGRRRAEGLATARRQRFADLLEPLTAEERSMTAAALTRLADLCDA